MEKILEKLARMNLSPENQTKLTQLLQDGKATGKVSSKRLIETLDAVEATDEQSDRY